jgi:hypothetical protein
MSRSYDSASRRIDRPEAALVARYDGGVLIAGLRASTTSASLMMTLVVTVPPPAVPGVARA